MNKRRDGWGGWGGGGGGDRSESEVLNKVNSAEDRKRADKGNSSGCGLSKNKLLTGTIIAILTKKGVGKWHSIIISRRGHVWVKAKPSLLHAAIIVFHL